MQGYPAPKMYEKVLIKKSGEPGFYGKVIGIKTVYTVSDGVSQHEAQESDFVIDFDRTHYEQDIKVEPEVV